MEELSIKVEEDNNNGYDCKPDNKSITDEKCSLIWPRSNSEVISVDAEDVKLEPFENDIKQVYLDGVAQYGEDTVFVHQPFPVTIYKVDNGSRYKHDMNVLVNLKTEADDSNLSMLRNFTKQESESGHDEDENEVVKPETETRDSDGDDDEMNNSVKRRTKSRNNVDVTDFVKQETETVVDALENKSVKHDTGRWSNHLNHGTESRGTITAFIEQSQVKRKEQTLCISTGGTPLECSLCSYKCYNKATLQTHGWTHVNVGSFKCSVCSFGTDFKRDLKKHERNHTGNKRYKCSYCSYSSTQKGQLKVHGRTHTGDKPYKCSYCSYTVSTKGNIQTHERTHTGERPYNCSYCSYSSAQKGYLKVHERIHTGDKPYKCSYCSYCATNKLTLQRHERTHTGDKPHKCVF